MSDPLSFSVFKEIFSFINALNGAIIILLTFILLYFFGDFVSAELVKHKINIFGEENNTTLLLLIFLCVSVVIKSLTIGIYNRICNFYSNYKEFEKKSKIDKANRIRIIQLVKSLQIPELIVLDYLLEAETLDFSRFDDRYITLRNNRLITNIGETRGNAVFKINSLYENEILTAISDFSKELALSVCDAKEKDVNLCEIIKLFMSDECVEIHASKQKISYVHLIERNYSGIFSAKQDSNYNWKIYFNLEIKSHLEDILNLKLRDSVIILNK